MVTNEWRPQVGERVGFYIDREEMHPAVPVEGVGVVVRDIRRLKAEQCDYEVSVAGHGDLCFFRSELTPWTP